MKRSTVRSLARAAALVCAVGSSSAWADRVYVRVAPPVPIIETRPPAPSHGHVWISGYHTWNGSVYVWTPGRWDLPPRSHARWVPGRWHRHRHGYYWVEGHWR